MTRWIGLMMCVGCVVHTGADEGRRVAAPPVGEAPVITDAYAEFEPGWGEPYWKLRTTVDLGDDPVDAVIMDIYDEGCSRCLVDSIELFERWDGEFRHDWHGSLEVFDPEYDHYVIDVWAIDTEGRSDVKEIWPR